MPWNFPDPDKPKLTIEYLWKSLRSVISLIGLFKIDLPASSS